jgi:hypothetical protein
MTKQTKMILGGVAVLGLAYYLLNRGKGMKNMDGVRMSRFANMTGMGLEMSDFANAEGKRLCVRTNPNGSTTMYTPYQGYRCYNGGTVQNV